MPAPTGSRHRFLDEPYPAGAGAFGRLLDRAPLDLSRAVGHAHQHARARADQAIAVHLLDEVLQHLLVIVKSAITPSFNGRMAVMLPGVRPSMFFASVPTASIFLPPRRGLLCEWRPRRAR